MQGLKESDLAKSIFSMTSSCNITSNFCDSVISVSTSQIWNAL